MAVLGAALIQVSLSNQLMIRIENCSLRSEQVDEISTIIDKYTHLVLNQMMAPDVCFELNGTSFFKLRGRYKDILLSQKTIEQLENKRKEQLEMETLLSVKMRLYNHGDQKNSTLSEHFDSYMNATRNYIECEKPAEYHTITDEIKTIFDELVIENEKCLEEKSFIRQLVELIPMVATFVIIYLLIWVSLVLLKSLISIKNFIK